MVYQLPCLRTHHIRLKVGLSFHQVESICIFIIIMMVTVELYVNMPTPVTIHWPAGVNWPDNEAPDMSEAGLYLFAFRRIKSVWEGSLNAKFTATA